MAIGVSPIRNPFAAASNCISDSTANEPSRSSRRSIARRERTRKPLWESVTKIPVPMARPLPEVPLVGHHLRAGLPGGGPTPVGRSVVDDDDSIHVGPNPGDHRRHSPPLLIHP